jgi:hypothetical protein
VTEYSGTSDINAFGANSSCILADWEIEAAHRRSREEPYCRHYLKRRISASLRVTPVGLWMRSGWLGSSQA